jgi:hypothetical protein
MIACWQPLYVVLSGGVEHSKDSDSDIGWRLEILLKLYLRSLVVLEG